MTKGIIVVDDIPVICAECDFASLKCSGKYLWCNIKKEFCNSSKPDWCPIKEMPEKKMCSRSICIATEEYYKRKGWNACIDEIEGSAEK